MLVCLLSFFYFLDLFAPRVSSLTRVCPLRNPQRSPPHTVTPDSGEDTKPSRRHNSRPPFILYGQRASEPSRRPSQHSSVPPKRATWHPRSLDPRVASPHSTRTQRPSPKRDPSWRCLESLSGRGAAARKRPPPPICPRSPIFPDRYYTTSHSATQQTFRLSSFELLPRRRIRIPHL